MRNDFTCFLIAVLSLFGETLIAQRVDTVGLHRNSNGKIAFAHVLNAKIENATNFLRTSLQMRNSDSLILEKETIDELGMVHKRYQQYYKGVKVENAEYMIHGIADSIETINGDFQIVNLANVIPSITEQEALSYALKYVNAKEYKWQDSSAEKFIKG